jgi:hypothetical protein
VRVLQYASDAVRGEQARNDPAIEVVASLNGGDHEGGRSYLLPRLAWNRLTSKGFGEVGVIAPPEAAKGVLRASGLRISRDGGAPEPAMFRTGRDPESTRVDSISVPWKPREGAAEGFERPSADLTPEAAPFHEGAVLEFDLALEHPAAPWTRRIRAEARRIEWTRWHWLGL